MAHEISRIVERIDNRDKTAGEASYTADLQCEGCLHGQVIASERARAKILGMEIPDLPDGCHVVGAADVPGENAVGTLAADWPVFADGVVEHFAQPILLVVGPDPVTVADLADAVSIDYEDIEPVLTIEEAEDPSCGAPPICGEGDTANLQAGFAFATGDPDAAFAAAARIVEGEYRTGSQEHIYLETQGMLAVPTEGGVTIHGAMQCPYFVQRAVARALGMAPESVRVVQATTGGAFGGKEDYPSAVACQAAVAAVKIGRPVRLVLERREDIRVTCKRHPARIRIRSAHDADGTPTAMDIDIVLDGGAFTGLSAVVLQRTMFVSGGVYRIGNIACRGRVLATNNVVSGAFRGFGGPQGLFAVEMHLEKAARELGLDPFEYKASHFVTTGDTTATGGRYHNPIVMDTMLARLKVIADYDARRAEIERSNAADGDAATPLRGLGHAFVLHGAGFTGSGERDVIKAKVELRRWVEDARVRVEILVANVEMGQGLQTTLRKIVSRVLEMPLDDIVYDNPDTARVPDSGPTVASRSTMIVGRLVQLAATELKERGDEDGEVRVIRNYEHPAHIRWDNDTFSGDAYPDYSWGVVALQVAVDRLTGELDIEHVWAVHDVGTPIDEQLVQGQVEGGILQGLGWASIEVLEQRGGRLLQDSLTDYIIPTACDAPPVTSELAANESSVGPFGAKGAGELTFVGAPIALASAVSHALGVPVDELPIRPEKLLEVLP